MSKGLVTKMNLSKFNQNVAMLSLQLWPGLLALRAIATGTRRVVLTIVFFLVGGADRHLGGPFASGARHLASHRAAGAAMAASTVRVLAIAWCIGFVLVLPLDFLAYKAESIG